MFAKDTPFSFGIVYKKMRRSECKRFFLENLIHFEKTKRKDLQVVVMFAFRN